MSAAQPLPSRPRIHATLRSDGTAFVTLPTGEVAEIRSSKDGHQTRWSWEICGAETTDGTAGYSYSQTLAYRSACEASARRCWKPKPVPLFTNDSALFLERATRTVFTRELKRLLVASTGHSGFSVRGDSGTAYGWISVRGTDERGRLWVAAIFGHAETSIPPTRGYRAWHVARAAGLSGEGIERREHAWEGN